jgi:hypothetical protein
MRRRKPPGSPYRLTWRPTADVAARRWCRVCHGSSVGTAASPGGPGLTPGNLITHLRKLEDAGYVTTVKSGSGVNARTSVSLSPVGRKALDTYTAVLRQLLDSASTNGTSPHEPGTANPD